MEATRSNYSIFVQKRREETSREKFIFVSSHCFSFVKLTVKCWSAFKNLRVFAFTLIQSVFNNFHFCGYPLSIAFSKPPLLLRSVQSNVSTFTKMEGFLSVFVQKRRSVNEADFYSLPILLIINLSEKFHTWLYNFIAQTDQELFFWTRTHT